jgi:hypothetical protein
LTSGSFSSQTTGVSGSSQTIGVSGSSQTTAVSGSAQTTGVSGSSQSGSTVSSSGISTPSGRSVLPGQSTLSAGTSTGVTTQRCEQMQAVNKFVSEHIIVSPTEIPKDEKIDFQPTSQNGVSFPTDEKTPTLTVTFGKPAEVQSVTIPRDKTPNANVERFEVTFFSPNGSAINTVPIKSSTSPKNNETKPAHVDFSQIPSNTLVSHLNITVLRTTDDQSPKGVILDIQACTESFTGK